MNSTIYSTLFSTEEITIVPLQSEYDDWLDWIEQASILDLKDVQDRVREEIQSLIKEKLNYYAS